MGLLYPDSAQPWNVTDGGRMGWSYVLLSASASWSVVVAALNCVQFCHPMVCSTPGFPALHYPWSLFKLMFIESVMPSNHLILCRPLLLLPSFFPSIKFGQTRSWWWTGRPGALQFMGSKRVGHDWATELNWGCRKFLKTRQSILFSLYSVPWYVFLLIQQCLLMNRGAGWRWSKVQTCHYRY